MVTPANRLAKRVLSCDHACFHCSSCWPLHTLHSASCTTSIQQCVRIGCTTERREHTDEEREGTAHPASKGLLVRRRWRERQRGAAAYLCFVIIAVGEPISDVMPSVRLAARLAPSRALQSERRAARGDWEGQQKTNMLIVVATQRSMRSARLSLSLALLIATLHSGCSNASPAAARAGTSS